MRRKDYRSARSVLSRAKDQSGNELLYSWNPIRTGTHTRSSYKTVIRKLRPRPLPATEALEPRTSERWLTPYFLREPTRWRFCITLLHARLFPKVWIFLWLGILSTRKCFSNKALQSVYQASLHSASCAYNLQYVRVRNLNYSVSLHLFKQYSLVHESIEYRSLL